MCFLMLSPEGIQKFFCFVANLQRRSKSVSKDVQPKTNQTEQLPKDMRMRLSSLEDKLDGHASRQSTSEPDRSRDQITLVTPERDQMQSRNAFQQHHTAPGREQVLSHHNAQRFHHLEQMFATIAATTNIPRTASFSQSSAQGCPAPCRCICHRRRQKPRALRLSTFKETLGALSFGFQASAGVTCDAPTCMATPESSSVKIAYTFPLWLFHATISAVFSNFTTTSPEFLLRVCRRIPKITTELHAGTLFAYVSRGEIDSVKRILRRREASVTDVKANTGETILHSVSCATQPLQEIEQQCRDLSSSLSCSFF